MQNSEFRIQNAEFAEIREELQEAGEDYRLCQREHAASRSLEGLSESKRRTNQAELRLLRAEHEFHAFIGARLAKGAAARSQRDWPTEIPARLRHYLFRWTPAREYMRAQPVADAFPVLTNGALI